MSISFETHSLCRACQKVHEYRMDFKVDERINGMIPV
jgi:hypothetical protein